MRLQIYNQLSNFLWTEDDECAKKDEVFLYNLIIILSESKLLGIF